MPRVSDQHRSDRRDEIVSAAVRCFAREGFHKTTMADVITESGLSAGAVYGYFSGKQELIRAVASSAVGNLAEALGGVLRDGATLPPDVVLRRTLAEVVGLGEQFGVDVSRLAIPAWGEALRDEELRGYFAGELAAVRALWREYVDGAQRQGLIDPTADPDQVALTMMGLMPGFLVLRVLQPEVNAAGFGDGLAALLGRTPDAVGDGSVR